MKSFIVLALCVAVAVAAPLDDPKTAQTLEYLSDNIGVNGFSYSVKTSDGKTAQEQGVLKNVGTENEAIDVTGSFSYVGPDGVTYSIQYKADEYGFQPVGAHIPQKA